LSTVFIEPVCFAMVRRLADVVTLSAPRSPKILC
jgi:hypothetical protein